ncbi:helix-turn-helix domain-containing protein [Bosea sp. NPDC055594]
MITPAQSRAARGLLGWSQTDLAGAAKVSISTIRDYETGKRQPIANNLSAIRLALEAAGMVFVGDGEPAIGSGPGVRLKSSAP